VADSPADAARGAEGKGDLDWAALGALLAERAGLAPK
jgi:hypothetical protein